MGPLSDHSRFVEPSSSLKNLISNQYSQPLAKDRGYRPGPAGAASVDSAVESWEESGSDTHRTRSSAGKCLLIFLCYYFFYNFFLKNLLSIPILLLTILLLSSTVCQ